MVTRFIRFVVVCLLAALGLLGTAATAGAADPSVTVVGAAAVPTSAPGTDQVTYTISIGNGPIEQVVMHAHQPDTVVAKPSSVVVDGSPAPAGTVDQAGAGLTIRLGTGADATHGGTLSTGNHTVTFDVAFDTLPKSQDSANAVVDYVVNGQTRHASSNPIALALPDLQLSLPEDSGEDQTLPLGTGDDGDFEVILHNAGGQTPAATLTITLPAGLTVDNRAGVYRDDNYRNENDFGGDQLTCSAVTPTVVRCALGAVAAGTDTLLDIPVQATPAGKVGTTGTFTVSALSDDGLDQNLSDNTVHGTVLFAGTAHLVVTVNPMQATVTVGKSAVLSARVRNDGPDPALDALGAVILENEHFTITGFTGQQVDPSGLFTLGSSGSKTVVLAGVRQAFHRTTFHRNATGGGTSSVLLARGTSFVLWNVGTIAPGKSVSAQITIKARSLGKDRMAVLTRSAAGDGACTAPNPASQCDNFRIVNLRAIRAVTPPGGPTTGRTGPVLAETGTTARTEPLIVSGTLAVALGAGLLLLTRRRPSR